MLTLRPYQELAADFLYERNKAMILAPVGAGKTAITLTAISEMPKGRWLVLAPKRVCTDVWPNEKVLWAPELTLALAVGTPAQRRAALSNKSADIIVMNYENLQWLAKGLIDTKADLFDIGITGVVFDELTRMKNPSGARFKALEKIIKRVPIVWGLTGSFTSNGLEDVYGQCKIVDLALLGRSKGAFLQEYFVLMNKEFGEWAPRKGSLERVMQRIKPATFLLEGKSSTTELHTVEMRCDMEMTDYKKMKRDFAAVGVTALNAAVVTGKLQQMASGFLYDTQSTPSTTPGKYNVTQTPIWLSSHKFDLLEELLEENQHANTIIAYTYKEELAELKRRFKVTTLEDASAIERWNRGDVELLAVHPKSAGHGLNLQHGGCHMVFLSLPWSLELYEQTIGRLHRSGQQRDVWVYVLMTNNTVDEKIWAALKDKRSISDIAIDALK